MLISKRGFVVKLMHVRYLEGCLAQSQSSGMPAAVIILINVVFITNCLQDLGQVVVPALSSFATNSVSKEFAFQISEVLSGSKD